MAWSTVRAQNVSYPFFSRVAFIASMRGRSSSTIRIILWSDMRPLYRGALIMRKSFECFASLFLFHAPERQLYKKSSPLIFGRLKTDRAAGVLHDGLHDVEPQPRPFSVRLPRIVRTKQFAEDLILLALWYTHAIIRNANRENSVFFLARDRAFDPPPLWGVLHRV